MIDPIASRIMLGMFDWRNKQYFSQEERDSFFAYEDLTTSKKSEKIRKEELLSLVVRRLSEIYEEKMLYYIQDAKTDVMQALLGNAIESN